MKVFLVDDDKIIRMGLRKIIGREGSAFEVVGEASNGFDALNYIEELKPSIVLTDIKMPIMDGIELIQKIKEKELNCKVIALSGFDEYSFVRKTLKNGAIDYLLKPINNKELIELLYTTKDRIVEEQNSKKQYELKINMSNSILRQVELTKAVGGVKSDKSLEYLNNYKEYSMAVFSKKIIYKSLETTYKEIKEKLKVLENENIFFIQYKENIIVLYKNCEHQKLMEQFNRYCEDDKELLIKLSTDFGENNTLEQGYNLCISKMLSNFYGLEKKKEAEFTKGQNLLVDEIIDKLISHLEILKEESLISGLKELYNVFKRNNLGVEEFKRTIIRLIDICKIKIDDFDSVCDTREADEVSIKETILWMKNGEIGIKYIIEYFRGIIKGIVEIRDTRGDKVIQLAKDYIKENYYRNISLSDVADYIFLNPNYLSELFKKKVGKNFIDYLVEIRINQSKELLKKPGVKIYEVAEAVGYSEYVSFNRAFKRIVGISPKEYIDLVK